MRASNKISAVQVRSLPPGKYNDGAGLWLVKRDDGGGQWVLRLTVYGRRREMGLGGIGEVTLKEAREEAAKWRSMARQGKDPIKERERMRREMFREDQSLSIITHEAFEARKASLKNDGEAGRWMSPLDVHVLPKLGRVPITEIDQRDIKNTINPIWHDKPDAARKAINRLGIVMKHAAALGLDVDLQAVDKAKALLGKQRHKVKHIPSLPWQEVPDFYQSLTDGSIAQLSLRLLILTAARSAEIRNLNLSEIDSDVWTLPAERMKAGREHRIPLSKEALRTIEEAMPFEREGFLFPGTRKGVISDATWTQIMKRRGMEARPHGFRSSFRTWCAEATDTPREVAETALAHVVGGAVERAYRRTDYLDQRRELMERWADHVSGKVD
ncbi:tyrosine-type recombinase/integrase [Actibacterium pelagium]|uniref:Integrase n=1 Tax=Actibacterium pelagium TaxID=2029103 RepID=A0A917ELG3_9RHOB|nr:site-specific integrase [Actibacterium pelagium]GGE57504.1 integrase [Actibacterium pelagium]